MHTSLISREQEITGQMLILLAQETSGNPKGTEETRKADSIQLKVKLQEQNTWWGFQVCKNKSFPF